MGINFSGEVHVGDTVSFHCALEVDQHLEGIIEEIDDIPPRDHQWEWVHPQCGVFIRLRTHSGDEVFVAACQVPLWCAGENNSGKDEAGRWFIDGWHELRLRRV